LVIQKTQASSAQQKPAGREQAAACSTASGPGTRIGRQKRGASRFLDGKRLTALNGGGATAGELYGGLAG
jgi:hypothetical protein